MLVANSLRIAKPSKKIRRYISSLHGMVECRMMLHRQYNEGNMHHAQQGGIYLEMLSMVPVKFPFKSDTSDNEDPSTDSWISTRYVGRPGTFLRGFRLGVIWGPVIVGTPLP